MAWYDNILSLFKNTPNINLKKAERDANVNNSWNVSTGSIIDTTPIINTWSVNTWSVNTWTVNVNTWSTTTWANSEPWLLWKFLNWAFPLTDNKWIPLGTKSKLEDLTKQNTENAHTLTWFSLDPYNITWNASDNPVNWTVTTEWKDQTKTWEEALNDAHKNNWTQNWGWLNWAFNRVLDVIFPITDKDWNVIKTAPDGSFTDDLNAYVNAAEQKMPALWAYNVNQIINEQWWWELQYKHPRWVTFEFNWVDKDWFNYDIQNFWAWDEAYNNGQIWKYVYESAIDELYDKYKSQFTANIYNEPLAWAWARERNWWQLSMLMPWFEKKDIEKWIFIDFMRNEKEKQEYQEAEYERRQIDIASDQSRARVADAYQYAINIIWPIVENSNIGTVEGRQEFMNDAKRNLIKEIWRWDAAMTQTYRVKAWMQRQFNVDDMYQLNADDLPEYYRDIYNSIEINERNYNQFIKNLTTYISLLPNYVDPNTWNLDEIPDAVLDPETWKMVTYRDMLFKDVSVVGWIWGNTYLFEDLVSPLDMLRKSSAQIQNAKSFMTDSAMWFLWDNVQYNYSSWLWYPVSELSQQTLWRLEAAWWNFFSSKSWEIPFEFVDMDTAIIPTITKNNSRRWRLMQEYAATTLEYTPELIWWIVEAIAIDKWMTRLWEAWQLWLQNLLNKIPMFRNTLLWRQLNLWISYTIRAAQRLWTDQIIDAALSIWDMEPGSEISKKLSVWWTLLGEWLWILADLRVLGKSFLHYFTPDWIKYWWLTDPIKLMYDNPWILNDYAASLWKWMKDESWKIVWDEYKLLLQDLSDYSKYLKKISDSATDVVRAAIKEWLDLNGINKTFKQWVYDVVKQVFAQDSAMAKAVTALLLDWRANVADMIKYIWSMEWTVKIWPWISTIKLTDRTKEFLERTVRAYDQKLDLIVDWWLVAWLNRWLTRQEVENLVREWFIKWDPSWDIAAILDDYFIPVKLDDWTVKYFATEKWLKALNVDTAVINAPLAVAVMSDDTRALIDKLKSLPAWQKNLSDNLIEAIWETDSINRLAESIADIKYLDICK